MLIKGLEFPEQLILDQRAGKLVIFAGAGVSLDPPSSLPTFAELTEKVVLRKLKQREKDQLDRILGASKKAGVNVHRLTREIIDKPGSQPTPLHSALLDLTPDLSSIRVVTTNFDRHFSSAAKIKFSIPPEEFYAPALPLGHDFRGIVYLHGSLVRDEQRFVLTDSDFGRAYLTEGWATRFLWSMFKEFTVLFVGYSHSDPVMHYLSKGLPSETDGKRYALTPEGDVSHWDDLKIIPIAYPIYRRRHKAMVTAVTAWAHLSAMGALDYDYRIQSIVQGSTHLSKEDSDFLLYAIRHTGHAKFFAKHAENSVWLSWAEENALLKPLFQPDSVKEDASPYLSAWIADKFLLNEMDVVLALMLRNGQQLNPLLWNAIARKLFAEKPRPVPEVLSRIIPILLTSSHPRNDVELLSYLIAASQLPGDELNVLMLFEYLTSPQLVLQRSFAADGDERVIAPNVEIDLPGNDHWLREAWTKVFAPNRSGLLWNLGVIAKKHLLKADWLLKSYQGPQAFDSISFQRSAIEPHDQDKYPGKLDVLIDATRDTIEYQIRSDPGNALHLIEEYYKNSPEIMRRIAIHGLAECPTIAVDFKITWLLDRHLLYDTGCVHEVYRTIKTSYPAASLDIRKRLIAIARKGFKEDRLDKQTRDYEVYNLLYWIKEADPSCLIARKAFQSIQRANPTFKPREHPDFHHWSSSANWVTNESPVSADALLAQEPAEQLEFLLTYQGKRFDGPSREGLLNTLVQAVQQNFEWGYRLSKALVGVGAFETDLWPQILRGWEDAVEDEYILTKILELFVNNTGLFKHDYPIANLLKKRFNEKNLASDMTISLAMRLAEMLFDHLDQAEQEDFEDSNDWLQKAINYSGGKLAEFWIQILSRARKRAGDSWAGLPESHRRCLDKMIEGSSLEAQLSRVFIASQIYFMFYLDSRWTVSQVLPLLDWSSPLRARQCWDGYLFWGRFGENTLPHVLPLYRRTFRELHTLREQQRRRFCEHMAAIATYTSINPLESGWLQEFITTIEESDRIIWAKQFGHILRGLDDGAVKLLWEQWLGKYWHRRNLGQPVPLSAPELGAMIEWAASLGCVLEKVVKLIYELPAPQISETYMFHLMKDKKFAELYPHETGRLLAHLLPKMTKPWMCHYILPLARDLRDAGLDTQLLTSIQNDLVSLGCTETV